MTLISNLPAAEWIALGARLVGATFLWAGAIKVIAPHTFQRHLSRFGWIPPALSGPAVTAIAGVEGGLGMALLIGLAPAILLPATLVLLALLTVVAWWGVHSGRTTDCGCYGGYIQPSIAQTIGLNALFALLVGAAWYAQRDNVAAELWQLVLVAATIAIFSGVTHAAQRFAMKNGRPMFETSPLKVGRRWKHSLAAGGTSDINGEVLVSYLGPDCPFCQQWVKVLNVMHLSPILPSVVGVVAASTERLDAFIEESGIRFPVGTISQTLMNRLVQGVPTTALVDSGTIKNLWVGSLPPEEFFDRFRQAFFPDPVERAAGDRH